MSNTKTGGPAFPVFDLCEGMTLRDYFAAKAMQAFIDKYSHEGDVSRHAYKVADEMLRSRGQT